MWVKVVAVQGHKGSGKTRLTVMLIEALRRRGIRVASAKHVHHKGFSLDQRGKDSWMHMEAGARPVVIISPEEVAVIWRGRTVERLAEIRELAGDADVLVMEGFYGMLSKEPNVTRIILIKDEKDLEHFREGIRATFGKLNVEGVYKLPDQFYLLLEKVLGDVDKP